MIKPSDVGKRVSLQFFDHDGARREAVGLFEKVEFVGGDAVIHVRKKDDSLVTVPMRRIRFSKTV
jgi:hypothetical protein